MSVRIGYAPGQFPAGNDDPKHLSRLVEVGERCGYDSIWLSDRVVGERFSPEPLIALAMVAAYSDTLKFGTSVLQLPVRNPVVLAKEIATLDYLSNGRVLPAIGLGQEDPREYEACGVFKEDRGPRTDEAMTVIRRLWQEDQVTHEGRFFTLHDVTITPKPVQTPFIPVWVGGRSRAAQARAGRVGDGWLVSFATPREMEEGMEVVFSTAAEYGREVDDDHIGAMLGFHVASTKAEATSSAEPYAPPSRTDVHFATYSALGTPQDIMETIRGYLEAGVTKFVAFPLCHSSQSLQQLELFGREVLPEFHQ